MTETLPHAYPGPRTLFRESRLPEQAVPAGYSALIETWNLDAPPPRILCAIGERHRTYIADGWRIMTPRHAPAPTLLGHLTFALKYEGLDLAVLKRLFLAVGGEPFESILRAQPTSSYARRIWFLYEWLTGERLELPDAEAGRYASVLDPALQWEAAGPTIPRYRLRNNLPGTPAFCPLVFRTPALERAIGLDLPRRAREVVAQVPKDVLARTAAFLLLKDSRSSYAIEGERPPQDRIQRWGRAIGEAGRRPIDRDELLRLQRIVIGDERFVRLGFRNEDGFVGDHDRDTRMPLPDHVDARHQDLPSLIDGMIAFAGGPAASLDPVLSAAVLAFGFVYIHPFEDGNGRLHRYLIHHVLAERGFNPAGITFPISAAIQDRIDDYRRTLESYSTRLLPCVRWRPTEGFNVEVLNDTADFYRYFDATPHAEFLYDCVEQTIERDLPQEADYLRRYDQFRDQLQALIDMPESTVDLLFRFLQQNEGRLSARARAREFAAFTDDEAERAAAIYAEAFGP
ncbi:Fic family protein [Brevundimonas sp.]|uniref:Fic family protein n=1 Tax=Brevundimonas sp. TaxID=1871086 RepID=UPI003D6CCBC8